jgi:hypothetical protein
LCHQLLLDRAVAVLTIENIALSLLLQYQSRHLTIMDLEKLKFIYDLKMADKLGGIFLEPAPHHTSVGFF